MEPVLPEKNDTPPPANNNNKQSNDENHGDAVSLSRTRGFYSAIWIYHWPVDCLVGEKDEMEVVDRHGRASLNFQRMLIAFIVCFLLIFVAIGVVLLPLVAIFSRS